MGKQVVGPLEIRECAVHLDGQWYDLYIYASNCGAMHYHDDPHEDGTPGQPNHHHHNPKCERIQAILVPVEDENPAPEYPSYHQKVRGEWVELDNDERGHPILIRPLDPV